MIPCQSKGKREAFHLPLTNRGQTAIIILFIFDKKSAFAERGVFFLRAFREIAVGASNQTGKKKVAFELRSPTKQ